MYRFILKRLLMLIPVLLGVSFIVYTLQSFAPGDPVQLMLGDNYSEESYAALPVPVRPVYHHRGPR